MLTKEVLNLLWWCLNNLPNLISIAVQSKLPKLLPNIN